MDVAHSEQSSAPGASARGFASMDRQRQREIASKGGQSVPAKKRSFSQNPVLAAQAGRKGGENVPGAQRSFSRNRELAAQAGRKGGQSSHGSQRSKTGDASETLKTVPVPEQEKAAAPPEQGLSDQT